MYLVKTPWWLKKLYPSSLIWNMDRGSRNLYLTFDDGPIPVVTEFVLNELKKFDAKATFFCIGDNVRKHPGIYQQIINQGHAVGNHTFNHLNGWKTKNEIYIENIQKCGELVSSNLFRPPYGRITHGQISNLKSQISDLKIVMWDVLSGDFDTKLSPEQCLRKTLQKIENGSIIVFHDSWKAFKRLEYVLPRFLEAALQKGYSFKALDHSELPNA